jgi:hypothetical protein
LALSAPFGGEAEVFDFVAGGTAADEADEARDPPGVVVVPDFVAFDGVASPAPGPVLDSTLALDVHGGGSRFRRR